MLCGRIERGKGYWSHRTCEHRSANSPHRRRRCGGVRYHDRRGATAPALRRPLLLCVLCLSSFRESLCRQCVAMLTQSKACSPPRSFPRCCETCCKVGCMAHPDYLEQSADPLIPNVWHPRYAWFRVSLLSEFVIQVPAFVIGMVALWNGTHPSLRRRQARVPFAGRVRPAGLFYDAAVHCDGDDGRGARAPLLRQSRVYPAVRRVSDTETISPFLCSRA